MEDFEPVQASAVARETGITWNRKGIALGRILLSLAVFAPVVALLTWLAYLAL